MRLFCIPALLVIWLYNPTQTPAEQASPPQKITRSTQQPATTDQRGTENSPISVRIIPTPETQEEAAKDARDRNDKATNDADLVRFSKDLVWVTGILGLIGFFQLIVFSVQAHRLKQTVDSTIAQNRPWILLAKETTVPVDPPHDWKFLAVLKNYGKTPARIISFHVEQSLGDSDQTPPSTSVFDGIRTFDPFVIPPHEAIEQTMRLPEPWAKDDVTAGRRFLWLCGSVRYSEAATSKESPYETTFCLVYRVAKGINKAGWQRGPQKYNQTT
jgi:hypothetical protein